MSTECGWNLKWWQIGGHHTRSLGYEHRTHVQWPEKDGDGVYDQTGLGALPSTETCARGLINCKICHVKVLPDTRSVMSWSYLIQDMPCQGTTWYKICHVMVLSDTRSAMSWSYLIQDLPCHGSIWYKICHVMVLSDTRSAMSWYYLIQDLSCHGTTWYKICHVMVLSDTRYAMSWSYLIQDLSCHGPIWYKICHVMVISDTRSVMSWSSNFHTGASLINIYHIWLVDYQLLIPTWTFTSRLFLWLLSTCYYCAE